MVGVHFERVLSRLSVHFCTERLNRLKFVSTWSQPDHEKKLRGERGLKREVKNKRKEKKLQNKKKKVKEVEE